MHASTSANITNPSMKPESHAWAELNRHAAAQLPRGFADRVLRQALGPSAESWSALFSTGAQTLRPGFAERVVRMARVAADIPSLGSHLALSAATAAICLGAVLFLHERSVERADARNIADWERIVEMADDDATNV